MKHLKKIFFVGNAHIDPVWMWRWQEGSAEAKHTIRSALDRIREYPEFIFVCSASQVFEWIEEFDPQMFEEIRQRVAEKRFIIVGGWFVQPDCNLPSGEGFARHSLYAQRYFHEKFGVTAKVGYNVDSFGHHAMIPQILKKSGMDYYVFRRPDATEKELPSHVFRWVSPDGSEVLAGRLLRGYNTTNVYMSSADQLDELLHMIDDAASADCDCGFFFYGVGNHGGGPTKKNIESILEHREKYNTVQYTFSDAEDLFLEAAKKYDSIPVVRDDLQHHASGCYCAVSQIKNGIRRAEWSMFEAENFSMMANRLIDKKIPDTNAFAAAWKNILFAHFHDSMGGCSSKSVYLDEDLYLKETQAMAQRTVNNMLQTVSWNIDTSDASKGIPIVFFNPHSFPVTKVLTINKRITRLLDEDGNEVPTQIVRSEDSRCRRLYGDTAFVGTIPAFGYATWYYHADKPTDPGFTSFYYKDAASEKTVFESAVQAGNWFLENENLRVEFSPRSGYITAMMDKKSGKAILSGEGAIPVVIDEYGYDTWAHRKLRFDKEIARFTDAKLEVLEAGPVRAKLKVVSRYNDSVLTQYFMLRQGGEALEVEAKIDWHEHNKMLKLRFQTACTEDSRAFYEIPYGVFERPADGEEEPGQSWIAVKSGESGIALLNDNKYSFSIEKNELNLSVVRSPYYIDHGRGNQEDTESEFTDQGEHGFCYSVLPFCGSWGAITKEARSLNLAPTRIIENNHRGTLPTRFEGLVCNADNVIISAWKRAENGKGMILRAYETDGKSAAVQFSGPLLPVALEASFTPFSIQTYYLEDGAEEWKEVLLTEFDL